MPFSQLYVEKLQKELLRVARFESQFQELNQTLMSSPRYDRKSRLVIRIAAITLASDIWIPLAQLCRLVIRIAAITLACNISGYLLRDCAHLRPEFPPSPSLSFPFSRGGGAISLVRSKQRILLVVWEHSLGFRAFSGFSRGRTFLVILSLVTHAITITNR